jgi:hypothetical protein
MRRSVGSMAARLLISTCAAALVAAVIGATTQASGTTGGPLAKEAKRVALVEVAHLKFTGENGATLIEHGQASGTYVAPVVADFTLHQEAHKEYVTAVVTIYPQGGSIAGTARAEYRTVGSLYYFGGVFTLSHGTGKYAHISEVGGKALGFSGIFNHRTLDAQEIKTKGEIIVGS